MTTTPTPQTFTPAALGRLGELVATQGIARHRAAVTQLVHAAQRLGVTPAAASVLGDDTASEVARLRALAVVSGAVAGVVPLARPVPSAA